MIPEDRNLSQASLRITLIYYLINIIQSFTFVLLIRFEDSAIKIQSLKGGSIVLLFNAHVLQPTSDIFLNML